jgi:hypothetical protein
MVASRATKATFAEAMAAGGVAVAKAMATEGVAVAKAMATEATILSTLLCIFFISCYLCDLNYGKATNKAKPYLERKFTHI